MDEEELNRIVNKIRELDDRRIQLIHLDHKIADQRSSLAKDLQERKKQISKTVAVFDADPKPPWEYISANVDDQYWSKTRKDRNELQRQQDKLTFLSNQNNNMSRTIQDLTQTKEQLVSTNKVMVKTQEALNSQIDGLYKGYARLKAKLEKLAGVNHILSCQNAELSADKASLLSKR